MKRSLYSNARIANADNLITADLIVEHGVGDCRVAAFKAPERRWLSIGVENSVANTLTTSLHCAISKFSFSYES